MEWKAKLRSCLKGRVAALGIGNVLRADDSLGPRVASALKETAQLRAFNCEEVPEKWFAPVRRHEPDVVLFVDAADFGGAPGEIRLLERSDLAGLASASTHGIAAGFLMEQFSQETGSPSFMLAVQPEKLDLGGEMSESCKRAVEEIVSELARYPW